MAGAECRGEREERKTERRRGLDRAKPNELWEAAGFGLEGGGDNLAMTAFAEVKLGVRNY